MTTGLTRQPSPIAPVDLWRADLDRPGLPGAGDLPAAERERAERILSPARRRRWAASRWALRTVLGRYLGENPASIDLAAGPHGKPRLAVQGALRFNLSHSAEVALVAVTIDREVGVDVERLGERARSFYEDWVRREAVAKCFGCGLGLPLPEEPVEVSEIDVGDGWVASLAATAGRGRRSGRRRRARPASP